MDINITDIATLTNEQIVTRFHKVIGLPPLMISYAMSILILLGLGLFVSGAKGKYYFIIFIYALFFSAVILVLSLSPNTVTQNIVDFFARIF